MKLSIRDNENCMRQCAKLFYRKVRSEDDRQSFTFYSFFNENMG